MADSSKGDILKVRLGGDTRRLVLYNTHISYDDLVLMLQRIYNGQLKSSDDVTLKYYDDDGDLITIADATDFSHAREYSSTGVVKMVIFVNGSDRTQPINAQDIRKELANVRDKVNSLVDQLDTVTLKDEQITYQVDNSANTIRDTESTTTNNTVYTAVVTEAISVFDPLKPSSDYSPVVTTNATTTQLPTTTTNFVPVSSSGNTSHLFTGQSSSFLESSPGVQYISQPTAPPPSSTPQPLQPYQPQPPNAGQTSNTHYTGGGNVTYPYTSQYQQQQPSTASHHYPPQPQGGQIPPQQPTASYAPYGAPPASVYQGNTYPPPGQPPAGRGYNPAGPPRNSPYRIGY